MTDNSNLPDLDELERLAKAALPGPWVKRKRDHETTESWSIEIQGSGIEIAEVDISFDVDNFNAAFIAAANPQTVLKLVGYARHLRKSNLSWIETANQHIEVRQRQEKRIDELVSEVRRLREHQAKTPLCAECFDDVVGFDEDHEFKRRGKCDRCQDE